MMGEQPAPRVRWQELTKSECFELLARERLGRVAVVDDRGPVVFPVNFVLDRHMVVLRTDAGTKLDAAIRGSRVAFEIDGTDSVRHTGWSVLVRGEAIEVTAQAAAGSLGTGHQDALRSHPAHGADGPADLRTRRHVASLR